MRNSNPELFDMLDSHYGTFRARLQAIAKLIENRVIGLLDAEPYAQDIGYDHHSMRIKEWKSLRSKLERYEERGRPLSRDVPKLPAASIHESPRAISLDEYLQTSVLQAPKSKDESAYDSLIVYMASYVPDLLGFRIVARTRREAWRVFDQLSSPMLFSSQLSLVSAKAYVWAGLLDWAQKRGYEDADYRDPEAVRQVQSTIEEADRAAFRPDDVSVKDSGYASLHIILEVKDPDKNFKVPNGFRFEIQIRSILEHAWATVEHKINYSANRGKDGSLRVPFQILSDTLYAAEESVAKLELLNLEKNKARRSRSAIVVWNDYRANIEALKLDYLPVGSDEAFWYEFLEQSCQTDIEEGDLEKASEALDRAFVRLRAAESDLAYHVLLQRGFVSLLKAHYPNAESRYLEILHSAENNPSLEESSMGVIKFWCHFRLSHAELGQRRTRDAWNNLKAAEKLLQDPVVLRNLSKYYFVEELPLEICALSIRVRFELMCQEVCFGLSSSWKDGVEPSDFTTVSSVFWGGVEDCRAIGLRAMTEIQRLESLRSSEEVVGDGSYGIGNGVAGQTVRLLNNLCYVEAVAVSSGFASDPLAEGRVKCVQQAVAHAKEIARADSGWREHVLVLHSFSWLLFAIGLALHQGITVDVSVCKDMEDLVGDEIGLRPEDWVACSHKLIEEAQELLERVDHHSIGSSAWLMNKRDLEIVSNRYALEVYWPYRELWT